MNNDPILSDDLALLRKYAQTRDAESFSVLVRRHAALVHGTCLRMLGNTHDAEDVSQECFLELARRPDTIVRSLPGWLHTLATSRARNLIRKAATRRAHENAAMTPPTASTEPTWDDLAPFVDEALEALPDECRQPLVLHYLQGKNQADTAAELGINQSTVSRRLASGVEELRARLSKAGIVASVALLSSLLATKASAVTVPASLAASLGKMALAGVGKGAGTTATSATVGSLFSTAVAKIAAFVIAGIALSGGLLLINRETAAQGSPMWTGATVTFMTADKAPEQFDAWTFFWTAPRLQNPKATFEFARLSPDESDHRFHRLSDIPAGTGVRSDTDDLDEVMPFQGQKCSVLFRVDSEKMEFPARAKDYAFAFYKKGSDGKVNWKKPFMIIPAVVEYPSTSTPVAPEAKTNATADGTSAADAGTFSDQANQEWMGSSFTFRTADKAPAQFDAWTFFWTMPKLEYPETVFEISKVFPNRTEHCVRVIPDDRELPAGESNRSDTRQRDEVEPCRGHDIRFRFSVDSGRMAFPGPATNYFFAFYKKDAKDKVNWKRPFQIIPAVVEAKVEHERNRQDTVSTHVNSLLSQARKDGATELVIAPATGDTTPVQYKVNGEWHDMAPSAHARPSMVAELGRLAQLPWGVYPIEGIIVLSSNGHTAKWRVKAARLEAAWVLTPVTE